MATKTMTQNDHSLAPVLSAVMGMMLAYFDILPGELAMKLLTLLATGAVTGAAGLLAQRVLRNLLARLQKRRLLLSILKDEADDK